MMRSLGQYRTPKGGWSEYWGDDGRHEREPSGAAIVIKKRPIRHVRIVYPTIAEVSASLRQGTKMTHADLMEFLALPDAQRITPPDHPAGYRWSNRELLRWRRHLVGRICKAMGISRSEAFVKC